MLSSPSPVISGQPYAYRDESDLHWTPGGVLQDAGGVPLRHEARLAPGVRIDFTSSRVGIEIKTGGGSKDTDTEKQLDTATAARGAITAILVITTASRHLRAPISRAYAVPVVDRWSRTR